MFSQEEPPGFDFLKWVAVLSLNSKFQFSVLTPSIHCELVSLQDSVKYTQYKDMKCMSFLCKSGLFSYKCLIITIIQFNYKS